MGVPGVLVVFVLVLGFLNRSDCQRPDAVNIGAVLAFNSTIGRVAKVAIESAVADVNADSSILNGTKLNLIMGDSQCNVFMGSIDALRLFEKGAVAIIGPLSSAIAHMISFLANGLQVPLVSFAATDPTLSSLEFPFFLRTTLSDSFQMTAMADLIAYYGWREVIVVFVDDDYGRNGISFLEDMLAKKMTKIHYKLGLSVQVTSSTIMSSLNESKLIGPRVYVLHVGPQMGLEILSIAHQLGMLTKDYAWLVTDWFSTALDSSKGIDLRFLQGVVGFRQHFLESSVKRSFMARWDELLSKGTVNLSLNAYGLYAYDTVWVVAHAIDKFLNEHGNVSFSYSSELNNFQKSRLQIEKLQIFDGGQLLLNKLLETNFLGSTGPVQFDSERNLMNGTYQVININNSEVHIVGYWSNYSGLTVSPPETLVGKPRFKFSENQQLGLVVWPGEQTNKPRGWVLATDERPMKIAVPNRASFVEFSTTEKNDTHKVVGFCIDVFEEAQKLLPYHLPYKFVPFGDGKANPSYDKLVSVVQTEEFDAAVGDIAIVTNRTRIVDFTQPYIATGLVIVTPLKSTKSSAWVFLKPFTLEMWCVTGTFFFLIGFVIWLLEHRINDDFRGPPKRQFITMCLYTASLTSILTIQQLSSPITGIDTLIASHERIGYQIGSFARSYMIENLNIAQSRLVELRNPEEYENALSLGPNNGGVAAVVDELPYVELFLSKRTGFGIVGDMFTKSGWGFAFQRDSPLAVDMSTAILNLSENGKLQELHDKWFCHEGSCGTRQSRHDSEPNQLHITSFWGLFLLCGTATVTAFLVFLLRSVRQFSRYSRGQRQTVSQSTSCSDVIYRFFDFIDEKEEAIKNIFKQQENTQAEVA
ncbi:hypothetical protein ACLOJK_039517 [Asimina triloba]